MAPSSYSVVVRVAAGPQIQMVTVMCLRLLDLTTRVVSSVISIMSFSSFDLNLKVLGLTGMTFLSYNTI